MSDEIKHNRPSELIYQIYPASFKDSSGDGHGDLNGITEKLDYIKGLHFDAIWISPFFLSPEGPAGDGGYAISDYQKIDHRYGTMKDFEHLIDEAHKKGLKVYTDFVMCHTSDEHEWFKKSQNREHGYENRYVWHDGDEEPNTHERIPPNNWLSVFTNPDGSQKSAWKYDAKRDQYFLHHFNESQPSLNLNDPAVQDASIAEMKFWLDKGVDGLRLDALPYANYDPGFNNNPWQRGYWKQDEIEWKYQLHEYSMHQPQTIELVAKIRKMMDEYDPPKTSLGEVIAGKNGGGRSVEEAAKYLDPKTGLNMAYHNDGFMRLWNEYPKAQDIKWIIEDNIRYSPDGGFCNNLGNHDFVRIASRVMGGASLAYQETITKQMMALAVAMPGSFCMYQGEELGLTQATKDELNGVQRDLMSIEHGGRDAGRTPQPWEYKEKNAGFSTSDKPYLHVPERHLPLSVDVQERQPDSMLKFTRRMLQQRQENSALKVGKATMLNTAGDIVAFTRQTKDQTVLCAFNVSGKEVSFKPSDYLDTHTLEQLEITKDDVFRLGAYASSFHGLRGQSEGVEVGLAPAPSYSNGNGHPNGNGNGKSNGNGNGHPKTIFALDLLIADHHIDEEAVKSTLAKIRAKDTTLKNGGKATISQDDHNDMLAEAKAYRGEKEGVFTAGGSTASALATVKKLLGKEVEVNLMGMASTGRHGRTIRTFLEDAGVKLVTPAWPDDVKLTTAVSHVIKHKDGKNTILTYPGTEIEAVTKALSQQPGLLENTIRHSDIVYMPESLTAKFGVPIRNDILKSRYDNKKELVLALPNSADFGASDKDYYKNMISSCNIVMGNDEEFCQIFGHNATRPINDRLMKKVEKEIQAELKKEVLKRDGMPCSEFGQVAFITRGNDHPAVVVTKDEITQIPLYHVKEIHNDIGASHATFAGFLSGYIKGLDHVQSAKLAVALAAEKVQQKGLEPYLIEPETSLKLALLRKGMGDVAPTFDEHDHEILANAKREKRGWHALN